MERIPGHLNPSKRSKWAFHIHLSRRNAPFSPSLWGFVSRLSDECPRKCLLITLALTDGPEHFAPLRLWQAPSMRGFLPSISWTQLLTLLKLISTHFWLWWEDSFINSIHVCCLQSKQYCLLMWAIFRALPPLYANAVLVLNWRIWGRGCLPGLQRQAVISGSHFPLLEFPGLEKRWAFLSSQGLFWLKNKSVGEER